ncbi:hypothetical protein F0562_004072 [Nyssa sinensis]|uniref:DNA2/NAM7 helicase helicase domain-containing protein n=1 Tax=Nyssa sinensis TaxID=561372 RepID=A0A5J5BWW9_9ASTE|nr:hypothetical protein F0562_004072 [Nyssa sinensis]
MLEKGRTYNSDISLPASRLSAPQRKFLSLVYGAREDTEVMESTCVDEEANPTLGYKSIIDLVFSWSIKDVLNKDLYKEKVHKIPMTFHSTTCYMKSFISPLMEEAHADLCSSMETMSEAPIFEILSVEESKDYYEPSKDFFYNIEVKIMRNFENDLGTYEPMTGDLIALTDVGDNCKLFFLKEKRGVAITNLRAIIRSFHLNDCQEEAVLSCITTRECHHQNTVKLIWGPPGTGKTKTVGALLFSLLQMKCRTLTCAPTNIAILEVTARVLALLGLVMESLEVETYGLGDIVLFGNEKQMKIVDHDDLLDCVS